MGVKLKRQNDYLLTEVAIDLPPDREGQALALGELDTLMRVSKGTGKVIVTYSDGGLNGINVEQKTKIHGAAADRVREAVGVRSEVVNGYHAG
jgi:hypothetical protein